MDPLTDMEPMLIIGSGAGAGNLYSPSMSPSSMGVISLMPVGPTFARPGALTLAAPPPPPADPPLPSPAFFRPRLLGPLFPLPLPPPPPVPPPSASDASGGLTTPPYCPLVLSSTLDYLFSHYYTYKLIFLNTL